MVWHLAGDPEAPEVGDYPAWPDMEEWDRSSEDGTSAPTRGHLRSLEQTINGLIENGFMLERLVEQTIQDVAGASLEQLGRLPHVSPCDSGSREYAVKRKLPLTLVIRAREDAGLQWARWRVLSVKDAAEAATTYVKLASEFLPAGRGSPGRRFGALAWSTMRLKPLLCT